MFYKNILLQAAVSSEMSVKNHQLAVEVGVY